MADFDNEPASAAPIALVLAPAAPTAPEYSFEFVAHDNFKTYKRGDVISDPVEIAAILDSHHESFVVKRAK